MSYYSDDQVPLLPQGSGSGDYDYPAYANSSNNTGDNQRHPSTADNINAWAARHSRDHTYDVEKMQNEALERKFGIELRYERFFAYKAYIEPDYTRLSQVLRSARSMCRQHLRNIATFKENKFQTPKDKSDAYKALKSGAKGVERVWNDVISAYTDSEPVKSRVLTSVKWVTEYTRPSLAFKHLNRFLIDANSSIAWVNEVKVLKQRFESLINEGKDTTEVANELREVLERTYKEEHAKEDATR